MYEDLNNFEKALSHFGTRVDIVIAMEMGNKIDPDTAYKKIKEELKELKKIRKLHKKDYEGPLYAPHPDLLKERHDH